MAEHSHSVDRRTVLRSIVAGSTVAAGAGLASAGSDDLGPAVTTAALEQQFGDVETLQGLFEANGEPLVDTLVENDFVDPSHDVAAESFVSPGEFSETDEPGLATVSPGRVGDTEVIDVRIQQRTDDHVIEYHVHPGIEDGYAAVTPIDGGDSVVAYPDGSVNSLATSACCPDTSCSSGCDGCGDTRCTTDICDCDQYDTTMYHTEERYCCNQDTDTCDCLCSWNDYDCDCPEDVVSCPE